MPITLLIIRKRIHPPYRDKGNININLENELSKERLIALMIMPKQNFRVINKHLKVRGISISLKRYAYDAQRVRNKGKYSVKAVLCA